MDNTVSWSLLPREWSVQVRHRSGLADAQSLFSTDSVQPALGKLIKGATNLSTVHTKSSQFEKVKLLATGWFPEDGVCMFVCWLVL